MRDTTQERDLKNFQTFLLKQGSNYAAVTEPRSFDHDHEGYQKLFFKLYNNQSKNCYDSWTCKVPIVTSQEKASATPKRQRTIKEKKTFVKGQMI